MNINLIFPVFLSMVSLLSMAQLQYIKKGHKKQDGR
nr:MAG TPA_asm: hypothetical protein [Caudoviricetes sp.]